ncbi:hypothetical protein PHMEG_00017317 [Phytophthora megakarya]|uniref:Integrase catalytic domain-containing protein n=1 Tax=Phytophthora megakarya TaxID=4795 RepID=A0A225VWW9_9STRA|nr:hypothetical protein PHMEG_00017317 [Phytophthora megakarya]
MKRWQVDANPGHVELRPLRSDYEWPSLADIQAAQTAPKCSRPTDLEEKSDGLWHDNKDRLWIPTDAEVLLFRLMVIAHCGVQVMVNHLQEHFQIEKLATIAREFCSHCLLCCHVKGSNIIPRSCGEIYRSKERNEALHMDYLLIGDYKDASGYILVLKDDFSHFCELIQCSGANATTAATAILEWSSRYEMPKLLISDTAAHFKNQLLEELCHKTQMAQRFTLAYWPWINDCIERLNRDILQVLRVMLLEYKVEQAHWADLLPLIQANLNQIPVASLRNHAPAEVFIGVKAAILLQKVVIGSEANAKNVLVVDTILPEYAMRYKVYERQLIRGAQKVNFSVGDYVLWSRVDAKKNINKLGVKWVGPYRVIGDNVNSFEIEHLLTGKARCAHALRLKLCADEQFDVNEEILEHIANQDVYLTVEQGLVHWEGLEHVEDSWEPMATMVEDVPVKFQEYVNSTNDGLLSEYVLNLQIRRKNDNHDSSTSNQSQQPRPRTLSNTTLLSHNKSVVIDAVVV